MKPMRVPPAFPHSSRHDVETLTTPAARSIRVLLIEDRSMMRDALRTLLENSAEMRVTGEIADISEARLVATETYDVALLAVDSDEQINLDGIARLRKMTKDIRLLVLTGIRDAEFHCQAVRMGAMGVVMKEESASTLLKAIQKVHEGEIWLERAKIARLINGLDARLELRRSTDDPPEISTLTKRERDVIALLSEGLRNKKIAERLFISEPTVRHHLTSIFEKLDVSDRFELLIYAFRYGLIKTRP